MRHPCMPTETVAAMREFSHALRIPVYGGENAAVQRYRDFLRSSVREVLAATFPLLSSVLNEHKKTVLAERFLGLHGASQPAFPRLADELVSFVQQHQLLSADELALMEYDWVLFDCEMAQASVPSVSTASLTGSTLLHANPVMHIIRLPWKMTLSGPLWSQKGDYIYALYRDARFQIMLKELSGLDTAVLGTILSQARLPLWELERQSETDSGDIVREWILNNREIGLIWVETL